MRVIALDTGYDNIAVRNAGDEFDMPDDVFERRARKDAEGRVIEGVFYDLPAWFEPVDKKLKAKIDAEREAIAEANASAPVSAVNPAKQQADYLASINELREEIAALKAAQKPK